uniref:Uncharacterized protein n=1 Tax=Aegilops tauschii TaxID=37682 RepID=N1QRU9_AEGTA
MPRTSTAKKALKSCDEDRISNLPDDILHHVLGFLHADEAVRTCLLSRRWRYLWKFMRRLRINDVGRRGKSTTDVFLNKFMSYLLLLRDPGSTLDEVEIEYDNLIDNRHFNYGCPWVDIWIRHALSCQAQVLTVKLHKEAHFHVCLEAPLVSQHLRRLEIYEVQLKSNFLNFSSCSALEELKIKDCNLKTNRILSQSLKHLSITGSAFLSQRRICISVPNLVSLQLINNRTATPLLESMPSLETAVIRYDYYTSEYCHNGVAGECCGICADCCGNDDHNEIVDIMLLHFESDAVLVAKFIFKRDLRWCPTFSKLKNLLLNGWCVQPDLRGLVSILEHSPILENLTLQLCKQQKTTGALEVEENPGLMEKPGAISGYLKIIRVRKGVMEPGCADTRLSRPIRRVQDSCHLLYRCRIFAIPG